ncbi:hypothetical protein [Schaedlerella arabinosiphila]|uniref:hypothetical protein n=1 Tax=Schaedlerella arabinosiphila TaxID=2044587 RepID=UPI002557CE0B|nr:hypothetical protein [Schaedlerella arabinosiphila]
MDIALEQGCIDIWIDDIVPCLQDTETGELKETVVFRIESRKYLKEFHKKNGWHINWYEIPKDVEVYALALKENNEIQGLIGIRKDNASNAAYMHWACTAPQNNIYDTGKKKYAGVGGHLFAIAAEKSIQWGFEGTIHGFAANAELLNHYIEKFHAEYLGMLHQYQFFIDEYAAKSLLEVYHYEWNET